MFQGNTCRAAFLQSQDTASASLSSSCFRGPPQGRPPYFLSPMHLSTACPPFSANSLSLSRYLCCISQLFSCISRLLFYIYGPINSSQDLDRNSKLRSIPRRKFYGIIVAFFNLCRNPKFQIRIPRKLPFSKPQPRHSIQIQASEAARKVLIIPGAGDHRGIVCAEDRRRAEEFYAPLLASFLHLRAQA